MQKKPKKIKRIDHTIKILCHPHWIQLLTVGK